MTADTAILPAAERIERRTLELSWSDYKWPLLYLLSMSMVGLWFPLGFILVPFILINRFRNNRYDFVIMLTIFLAGCGFTAEGTFPFKTFDVALALSVILILVHRNHGIVKKTVIAWVAYCACIFFIATFSEETLSIQFRLMRYTFAFSCFIIPVTCFSSREFDIRKFFRCLMPYLVIICIFYILDGLIICGFIFLPRTPVWGMIPESYFYSPLIYGFPDITRKYPQGLILIALAIYPLCKYYKLKLWHWIIFAGACAACQTFTVISGFFIGIIVSMAKAKNVWKYIIGVVALFTAVYYIDGMLPEVANDARNDSFFRVKSSIDQILALSEIQDDADFADLGSGRMAQALPKIELVGSLGREMTGLGFLHPTLTTNPKYIIDNEYYIDSEKSEEGATKLIETEVLQVYVTTGWMGLLVYFAFYIYTFVLVRKFAFARYYLSVLIMAFWFGMGAYGGLTAVDGLLIVSLAYGMTILAQRGKTDEKKEPVDISVVS